MCGINCAFDPFGRLPNKALLVQMMDAQMRYRGPDDEGTYADAQVALGMRRLSIIDVAGGHQPVYNEDKSIVLVFNGEIYNYVELMGDLKARGHRFSTCSDTETVVHLYEEKGEACLQDVRGMFAFVLWDARRERLLAARDRIGIKPLYIAEHDGVLWLSSELKAIVGAASITPTLHPVAVCQFLLYGYAVDQRHTVVEEIKRVLPGEYIVADAAGVAHKRYWSPHFGGEAGLADCPDQGILETLETSVQLHLRSDVPVGILLSSGIDSAAVAAFAARSNGQYTAVCAGYSGAQEVDERPQAHRIADHLKLAHVDVVLDDLDYNRCFDDLVACCDEPVGDRAAMPQWALYKQSRERGYKVLLTGNGGDEVFGGYPFWNMIGATTSSLGAAERPAWNGLGQTGWVRDSSVLFDQTAGPELREAAVRANESIYSLRDQAPWGPDAMASIVFGTYLVHNGCFLADKLAMGCSVEARVPLLDHVLIEHVLGLPLHRRFDSTQSKLLLRRILRGILPDWVLALPKRGFTPPAQYLERLVSKHSALICEGTLSQRWLECKALRELVRRQSALPWFRPERLRRRLNIGRSTEFLYRILSFERWFDMLTSAPRAHRG